MVDGTHVPDNGTEIDVPLPGGLRLRAKASSSATAPDALVVWNPDPLEEGLVCIAHATAYVSGSATLDFSGRQGQWSDDLHRLKHWWDLKFERPYTTPQFGPPDPDPFEEHLGRLRWAYAELERTVPHWPVVLSRSWPRRSGSASSVASPPVGSPGPACAGRLCDDQAWTRRPRGVDRAVLISTLGAGAVPSGRPQTWGARQLGGRGRARGGRTSGRLDAASSASTYAFDGRAWTSSALANVDSRCSHAAVRSPSTRAPTGHLSLNGALGAWSASTGRLAAHLALTPRTRFISGGYRRPMLTGPRFALYRMILAGFLSRGFRTTRSSRWPSPSTPRSTTSRTTTCGPTCRSPASGSLPRSSRPTTPRSGVRRSGCRCGCGVCSSTWPRRTPRPCPRTSTRSSRRSTRPRSTGPGYGARRCLRSCATAPTGRRTCSRSSWSADPSARSSGARHQRRSRRARPPRTSTSWTCRTTSTSPPSPGCSGPGARPSSPPPGRG